MKKLFGGINMTWKKLIIFAIAVAVYTAIMLIIPITKDTSFRDIGTYLEWWILFGVIIICNSKSPKDSALKCFVFFLISQPLIYLIQAPFSSYGFGIFSYYKYWFIITIACLPMGFIGYYINKKSWLSFIIILPMLLLVAYDGLGYFNSVKENFPYHLLSLISCIGIILIIVFNVFDKTIHKVLSIVLLVIVCAGYIFIKGGISTEFETVKSLDDYDIKFKGQISVSYYHGTAKGNVEVVSSTEDIHTVKVNGIYNGKYEFTITDESNNEYDFKYYYDKESKSVVLERQ